MSDTEKLKSPWPMERGDDAVRKLEYIWDFLQIKRRHDIELKKLLREDLKKNANRFLMAVEKAGEGADLMPIVRSEIQELQEWLENFARFLGEESATFDCLITCQIKLEPKEEDKP